MTKGSKPCLRQQPQQPVQQDEQHAAGQHPQDGADAVAGAGDAGDAVPREGSTPWGGKSSAVSACTRATASSSATSTYSSARPCCAASGRRRRRAARPGGTSAHRKTDPHVDGAGAARHARWRRWRRVGRIMSSGLRTVRLEPPRCDGDAEPVRTARVAAPIRPRAETRPACGYPPRHGRWPAPGCRGAPPSIRPILTVTLPSISASPAPEMAPRPPGPPG